MEERIIIRKKNKRHEKRDTKLQHDFLRGGIGLWDSHVQNCITKKDGTSNGDKKGSRLAFRKTFQALLSQPRAQNVGQTPDQQLPVLNAKASRVRFITSAIWGNWRDLLSRGTIDGISVQECSNHHPSGLHVETQRRQIPPSLCYHGEGKDQPSCDPILQSFSDSGLRRQLRHSVISRRSYSSGENRRLWAVLSLLWRRLPTMKRKEGSLSHD